MEPLNVGITPEETRIGTFNPYDFAYWASTFVADGSPDDYMDYGPETDGTSLVAWAAGRVGVGFTSDFAQANLTLSQYTIPTETALTTRGALLVGYNRMAVCMGLGDVVSVVTGRYFQFKTESASWDYGAHLPGLIYH